MITIVTVAGDAGGAAALAPVLTSLARERINIVPFAYGPAADVWTRSDVPFTLLTDDLRDASIVELIDQARPQLVLTATSVNGVDFEKQFIAAASLRGVPTVAVLDFWSNYRRRFAAGDGSLQFLPDRIAVMDTMAASEMISCGFDATRLVVTGQPAFDTIAEKATLFSSRGPSGRTLSCEPVEGETIVLFASQPISAVYGNTASEFSLGYEERSVLNSAIEALQVIGARRNARFLLVVRAHPAEKNLTEVSHLSKSHVRCCLSEDADVHEAAVACGVVVGMCSVLLLESWLLGCKVASLQPGLRMPDPLPISRAAIVPAAYTSEAVEGVLENLLFGDTAQNARLVEEWLGGTERVCRLVHAMATQTLN